MKVRDQHGVDRRDERGVNRRFTPQVRDPLAQHRVGEQRLTAGLNEDGAVS